MGKVVSYIYAFGISLVAGIIVSMVLIGLYPQVSVYIIGEKSKIVVFLLIANIFSNILQRFAKSLKCECQ